MLPRHRCRIWHHISVLSRLVLAIAQCPARYSKAGALPCPKKWHLRYKWEALHFQGPSGSCKQRLNALFIVSLLITSQQMHALCYTYVGATMGASYAPPAYYADLLAERGRCYIKRFLDGTLELRGQSKEVVRAAIGSHGTAAVAARCRRSGHLRAIAGCFDGRRRG